MGLATFHARLKFSYREGKLQPLINLQSKNCTIRTLPSALTSLTLKRYNPTQHSFSRLLQITLDTPSTTQTRLSSTLRSTSSLSLGGFAPSDLLRHVWLHALPDRGQRAHHRERNPNCKSLRFHVCFCAIAFQFPLRSI